ncbi:MAG: Glycine cleavage system protein [Jatrophihabitans sp.]|jgi:glycine cleavage system H protein|nr:Glycine cleavage system protein [Jatrophihabitans sp.]MDT4905000.1 glycine cleavage system protein [Pseudonocardiales bacterium]MDT4928476.1 glycine cleavage system protein [Pseudonocardiales bacterium]MDT4950854.1 glycine cleavage system protein [Pseudonocardiales bacterium]
MSDVPDDLKYTAEHEWVRAAKGSTTVRVGITDYAQEALGDVVYVSLPEVGADVAKGAAVGEIESTKSVSDIYAPLTGTVTARNEALDAQPELINSDPYGEGWLLEIEVTDESESQDLLDAAAYGTVAG